MALFIEAGSAIAKAPAKGFWPLTIIVGALWVRRLAKSMPAGDPIHLRVDEGRLHTNRYSRTLHASGHPVDQPLQPRTPPRLTKSG